MIFTFFYSCISFLYTETEIHVFAITIRLQPVVCDFMYILKVTFNGLHYKGNRAVWLYIHQEFSSAYISVVFLCKFSQVIAE